MKNKITKIALHDGDGKSNKNFPNLPLMKISAYYKKRGADVEWFSPLHTHEYNKIFSSKVFTFSNNDDDKYLSKNAIKGGTGYNLPVVLSNKIEHICPDYSLYNTDYATGFLTRGCIRKCDFCVVPTKEGDIRANADFKEFTQPQHKKVVFLDNNVLAHPHGIEQIELLGKTNLKVDFNQGLDARLIDNGIAMKLGKLKWIRYLWLACDHKSQMESVRKAVELLRWHNCNPAGIRCYVLVRDIDDALERVRFLKGIYVDPFAQPYRDQNGTPATKEQRDFSRWTNNKWIYRKSTWENYKFKR